MRFSTKKYLAMQQRAPYEVPSAAALWGTIFQGYFGLLWAKWPVLHPIPTHNMRFEVKFIFWRRIPLSPMDIVFLQVANFELGRDIELFLWEERICEKQPPVNICPEIQISNILTAQPASHYSVGKWKYKYRYKYKDTNTDTDTSIKIQIQV